MMSVGTALFTLFNGRLVGADNFGNRYYQEKKASPETQKKRRWVIYRGLNEPSKVPPEWHAWLHYTADESPTSEATKKYSWIKPHLPNLTGTKFAYFPPGHMRNTGKRKKATGDYSAWKP